jgi:CDP-paratose 2-epimerase
MEGIRSLNMNNKKIVVTGGCGFLGSHVCELFKEEGWDVIAYDNLTKFEYNRAGFSDAVRDYNLKYLENIGVTVIVDDILNYKMLEKCIRGADFVAHCAAQPAMTIAIENPTLDCEVNIKGTLNVLNACKTHCVPCVNCSTIHVYGNGLNRQIIETQDSFNWLGGLELSEHEEILTGKITPLHVTKRTTELYFRTFWETYGLNCASFRLTGIYGPRQFGGEDHGWVANFAIKAATQRQIKVFGTDKQVRDILHVRDAANAFLRWYIMGTRSGIFNIGGGLRNKTSIKQVLEFLRKRYGTIQVRIEPERQGDLWWFVSKCEKAENWFTWRPNILPQDGLEHLCNWIDEEKEIF